MLVVMVVIVLLLALGVPAFNSMTRQSRLTQAQQKLNGLLTRANIIAVSDRALTAVRIVPAHWAEAPARDAAYGAQARRDRQAALVYEYRSTSIDPTSLGEDAPNVRFDERFERLTNDPVTLLPTDTWVAPAEALLSVGNGGFRGDAVVQGIIDNFEVDAVNDAAIGGIDFLNADDFLVVFDPETGLQPAYWPEGSQDDPYLRRSAWPLLGYDPQREIELAYDLSGSEFDMSRPFRRFNFTGVVIYPREPFVTLGRAAAPRDRQEFLRQSGTVYWVNRNGGNLFAGRQTPE